MFLFVVIHSLKYYNDNPQIQLLGLYYTYEKAYDRMNRYQTQFESGIEDVQKYLSDNYEYVEYLNDRGMFTRSYADDDFYYGYEFSDYGPFLARKMIDTPFIHEEITIECRRVD